MKNLQKHTPDFEEVSKPLFDTRNYHGYFQVLQVFETEYGETYYWRFHLAGFSYDNKSARIMKWDRRYEIIPIDKAGRISVGGKVFGPLDWDH